MKYYNHLYLCKALALLVLSILLTHSIVFGQNRLSDKFTTSKNRMDNREMIFSVSYRDPIQFNKKYLNKIIVQHVHAKTVVLKTSYDVVLQDMAIDPNIIFIDIVQTPTVEAGIDFVNPAFNRITKVHHQFPELQGLNQKISIKEEAFDTTNIDLRNRSFKTPLSLSQTSQHATNMATFIAGAGNSSSKGIGVAPAAHLTSSDFTNLLPDDVDILSKHNIHLQNHSYGVVIENYYGNEAAAYDQQVFEHQTQMNVFSVGNSGHTTPGDGTYKNLNYANLSGNFKQAKNVIAVTAVDTTLLVNSLNSKGPTYDGRLKPELAAYGQSGTSDAAALVTGSCALLQEKYQQTNGELPTASMIKAILIASATDIGPAGIDYIYGYGSLNTYKAIQLTDLHYNTSITLASNNQISIPINVPTSTAELRVVVTWIDPPAIQNAAKALVNDIDAYLSLGSDILLPWVLSSQPNTDSLSALAKRKEDHLNTVEYITVSNPAQGLYQLTIKAPQLTTTTQPISIAYWFEKKDHFEWDYPTASDILEAHTTTTLFWDQNVVQKGALSYQLNNGDWRVINPSVDLTGYFHWKAPDTLSVARLKMEIGSTEYVSDKFMISPQPNVAVDFVCDNDFSLTWKSIPNASAYRVYTLGEQYLNKVVDTNDTSIVFNKNQNGLYFSIAPILHDSVGLKSETIDYTLQGSLCYLNLFEAVRYDSEQVKIQIKLSTLRDVDHIIVYKILNYEQNIFVKVDTVKTQQMEWYDTKLVGGVMRYQAEVVLKNGTHLKSDISEVYIEIKNKAILFPNPVTNSEISILSEGVGIKIRILDSIGRLVLVKYIESSVDNLDVTNLKPGLYLYQLERNGKAIDSGKFIRQ